MFWMFLFVCLGSGDIGGMNGSAHSHLKQHGPGYIMPGNLYIK